MNEYSAAALPEGVDPAWLPSYAFRPLGSRRVRVAGTGPLVATVRAEVAAAVADHGGTVGDDGPADRDVVCSNDAGGDPEAFTVERSATTTAVRASGGAGLLYGFRHVVRLGEAAFGGGVDGEFAPRQAIR